MRWFALVCAGSRWFALVPAGLRWFALSLDTADTQNTWEKCVFPVYSELWLNFTRILSEFSELESKFTWMLSELSELTSNFT